MVSKNCALGYYSLGHELGHNIGLDHDMEHARQRPYKFGTGHLLEPGKSAHPGGFRSIMSYAAEGHEGGQFRCIRPLSFRRIRTPNGSEPIARFE